VCWDMIFHSLSIHRSLDWISKEKTKRENSGEEKVKRVTVKVQSWVVVHSRSTRLYVQLFFILFSIRIITQDPCWLNKKKPNHSITLKTRKSLGEPRSKNYFKREKQNYWHLDNIFVVYVFPFYLAVCNTIGWNQNRGTK
jgi:hypothetical protein